ncbi:MAG: hypothetical protein WD904_11010 [Dehalococcoidia bacterium]
MPTNVVKLWFVATAVIVALMLAAIAVAQSDSGANSTETPGVVPTAPFNTPDATDGPIDFGTPPTDQSDPLQDDDSPPADDEGTAAGSIEGTTPALNPGGHCVELPNDSDVVQNPDKHPNWITGGCEPGQVEPPEGQEPLVDGNGPPDGTTPSLNPEGVCVGLPNNSDVVRNPDKHPNWTVGGCELSTE